MNGNTTSEAAHLRQPVVGHHLPLSLQIYKADTEWGEARNKYRVLESQYKPLRAQRILALTGSVAARTLEVEASDWHRDYLTERDEAEKVSHLAKAKYNYLVELAKEQRDEGYHERVTARL